MVSNAVSRYDPRLVVNASLHRAGPLVAATPTAVERAAQSLLSLVLLAAATNDDYRSFLSVFSASSAASTLPTLATCALAASSDSMFKA